MSRFVVYRRPACHTTVRGWWLPPIFNPFALIGVLLGAMVVCSPLLLIPWLGQYVLFPAAVTALWLLVMGRWTVQAAQARGWVFGFIETAPAVPVAVTPVPVAQGPPSKLYGHRADWP